MVLLLLACATSSTPETPTTGYIPVTEPTRTYPTTRGGICVKLADCGCADVNCYQTLADAAFNDTEVASCILAFDCKTLCTTQQSQACVSSYLKKSKPTP